MCFIVCVMLDQTNRKLFTLQCTEFPLRPQPFHSENDSGLVCVVIVCDITTLISSLVIVETLWTERLNNERVGAEGLCASLRV